MTLLTSYIQPPCIPPTTPPITPKHNLPDRKQHTNPPHPSLPRRPRSRSRRDPPFPSTQAPLLLDLRHPRRARLRPNSLRLAHQQRRLPRRSSDSLRAARTAEERHRPRQRSSRPQPQFRPRPRQWRREYCWRGTGRWPRARDVSPAHQHARLLWCGRGLDRR